VSSEVSIWARLNEVEARREGRGGRIAARWIWGADSKKEEVAVVRKRRRLRLVSRGRTRIRLSCLEERT